MLPKFENNIARVPESMKWLQNENNLYLYGNGAYAEKVFGQLEHWDVILKGVIVSDEYYIEGSQFHGLKVISAGEIKDNKIDVIAGYNILVHEELNEMLLDSKNVDKVYYLDGLSVFVHDMCLRQDIVLMDNYYKRLLDRKFDYAFYHKNLELFTQTYDWMEDYKSKDTMGCFLRGHIEVKDWPMLPVWKEQDMKNQYFPNDIINLSQDEIFVDCGAFTGDTLDVFSTYVDTFDKYYALEPDKKRFDGLNNIMKRVECKGEIIHLPIGVSDKKGKLYFSSAPTECGRIRHDISSTDDCEYNIEVDSIDNLLECEANVTFIKMDIEGEELLALKGASKIIQKYRPKLAICVYHKREDLITIPQYLKSIVPEYKLYLRAHRPCAQEVVLYCVCQ